MKTWQLQEARDRLSKLIDEALVEPQLITRRGEPIAIILSCETYRRLKGDDESLYDFFRSSPMIDAKLTINRDNDPIPDQFVC